MCAAAPPTATTAPSLTSVWAMMTWEHGWSAAAMHGRIASTMTPALTPGSKPTRKKPGWVCGAAARQVRRENFARGTAVASKTRAPSPSRNNEHPAQPPAAPARGATHRALHAVAPCPLHRAGLRLRPVAGRARYCRHALGLVGVPGDATLALALRH